tara:strand:+ start:1165 stop:1356 length:192 start_codon:yes stop_codon:yes gene_type:complete
MDLQEKFKQLKLERDQLSIAYHEINGAMKLLELQILETQKTPEASQPSNTVASSQPEEIAPSK